MITIKDIKRKTGPSPGGSVNLYLIPWNDVQSIPSRDAGSKKIEGNIICKPGKRFHKYEFAPGKCKLSSSSTGSDGSAYFRTTISVTIPGDDAEMLSIFSDMINGHFIAILDQASKAMKLAGSMAIPLRCVQVDYDAGGEIGDPNGTAFQFENRGFMVEEYAGVIPLTPTEDSSTAWRGIETTESCQKGEKAHFKPTSANLMNSAIVGTFEGTVEDWHLVNLSPATHIQEEAAIKKDGNQSCKVIFSNSGGYGGVRTDLVGGYFENSEYKGAAVHTKVSAWIYIPSANPGLKEEDYMIISLNNYKSEFDNIAITHGHAYFIKDLPKDQWFQIQKVTWHQGDLIPDEKPYVSILFYGKDNTPFNEGGIIYIDNIELFEVKITLNPNTGFKVCQTLEEYYVASGEATGLTKPNVPEDPDYVAPIYDPISCPLP